VPVPDEQRGSNGDPTDGEAFGRRRVTDVPADGRCRGREGRDVRCRARGQSSGGGTGRWSAARSRRRWPGPRRRCRGVRTRSRQREPGVVRSRRERRPCSSGGYRRSWPAKARRCWRVRRRCRGGSYCVNPCPLTPQVSCISACRGASSGVTQSSRRERGLRWCGGRTAAAGVLVEPDFERTTLMVDRSPLHRHGF